MTSSSRPIPAICARTLLWSCLAFSVLWLHGVALAQMGTATPLPNAERQKAEAERKDTSPLPNYPQLTDITAATGIHFNHLSSPEAKFIAESMSGGVALIDYDGDGWPDIYFTNAQSVDMARHGVRSRSALFHNNRDGTFTDIAGTLVGLWSPGFSSAFSISGYHFHFLSKDRQHGGHLLDVEAGPLRLTVEALTDFHLALPESEAFLKADLSKNTADELAYAEQAH